MKRLVFTILSLLISALTYAQQPDFVVAQDGSGNFKTVQEAINAVPDFRKKVTTIFIKNGIYKEKLVLPGSKQLVYFKGESLTNTILTYDDFATKKNIFGEEKGTSGSSSFYVYGNGFKAENITFQNTSGPVGQAVAVQIAGDMVAFINCRFLGFQDTLYAYGVGTRAYFKNCYIEGTTDFIFGAATAVFENCEVFSKKGGLYITAASTPDTTKYGYVFINCKLVGDAPEQTVYLGRPWRPFAKTVFIDTEMGAHITPAGWHNWSKPDAEKTSFYAEYHNKGVGYLPAQRVPWSHQLTAEEAKQYTITQILRGWDPNK